MESANLQLPDQLVGSPAPLAAPSCYGFGSNLANWSSSTPTTTFSNVTNVGDYSNSNSDGIVSNSPTRQISTTDHHHHHHNILVSDHHIPRNTSTTTSNLIQDLGFPWSSTSHQFAAYNDQLAKIKEEFSEMSFPKFTEMLNSPFNSTDADYGNSLLTTHMIKNQHNKDNIFRDLSCSSNSTSTPTNRQNPLVKTLSSSCQINAPEFDHSNDHTTNSTNIGHRQSSSSTFGKEGLAVGCRGQFSQIYPSVNISNLSTQHSLMGMNMINLKPGINLDHLAASARFCNNTDMTSTTTFGQPLSNFGVDSIQQQQRTSYGLSKAVRKEKLGDRIAALQQLVSPFGKTDTASVLMEAIGYIKFLQNQVETLSVPYMKSSRNKSCKTVQGGLKDHQDDNEETKRDLKSRGLCLVPLSCMSYVTGDGGGESIWPPVPNFGGRIT
ncbi:hypothetical protein L484_021925 [Morus notabilis]|uniref:BHLH domain-containing protein n=1 Tax=Morus notabilis TaxID=981085 RepID=W9SSZ3_9ROSA|nr:hypothetical protein L484_021925 [Morus notabilis]